MRFSIQTKLDCRAGYPVEFVRHNLIATGPMCVLARPSEVRFGDP